MSRWKSPSLPEKPPCAVPGVPHQLRGAVGARLQWGGVCSGPGSGLARTLWSRFSANLASGQPRASWVWVRGCSDPKGAQAAILTRTLTPHWREIDALDWAGLKRRGWGEARAKFRRDLRGVKSQPPSSHQPISASSALLPLHDRGLDLRRQVITCRRRRLYHIQTFYICVTITTRISTRTMSRHGQGTHFLMSDFVLIGFSSISNTTHPLRNCYTSLVLSPRYNTACQSLSKQKKRWKLQQWSFTPPLSRTPDTTAKSQSS